MTELSKLRIYTAGGSVDMACVHTYWYVTEIFFVTII
jgi:hypothetical protein